MHTTKDLELFQITNMALVEFTECNCTYVLQSEKKFPKIAEKLTSHYGFFEFDGDELFVIM